ncbi:hypothetical protein JCM7686_0347 [Paracoccus aminophilus JCM 7686]|uniref:Uncharacterized protein n=1 Tax=Paracoccus aminophilus JCM 7686 TaxID=1367847 RepID=S5YQA2_PARAH|nr:hypothetical protein JCM7686_0347 [Paracoccus aminophilus JCM 7686]
MSAPVFEAGRAAQAAPSVMQMQQFERGISSIAVPNRRGSGPGEALGRDTGARGFDKLLAVSLCALARDRAHEQISAHACDPAAGWFRVSTKNDAAEIRDMVEKWICFIRTICLEQFRAHPGADQTV